MPQTILEYLKVLLSWPPIVLGISIFFFIKFQSALNERISNINSVKTPVFEMAMQTPSNQNQQEQQEFVEYLTQEQRDYLVVHINSLQEQLEATDSNYKKLEDQVVYWEFKYLNEFYIHNSKRVLKLVNNCSFIGLFEFNQSLRKDLELKTNEISNIIKALKDFQLVEIKDNLIMITSKGELFVKFLEWLVNEYGELAEFNTYEQHLLREIIAKEDQNIIK